MQSSEADSSRSHVARTELDDDSEVLKAFHSIKTWKAKRIRSCDDVFDIGSHQLILHSIRYRTDYMYKYSLLVAVPTAPAIESGSARSLDNRPRSPCSLHQSSPPKFLIEPPATSLSVSPLLFIRCTIVRECAVTR